jgi:hypothetical protein
MLHSCTTNAKEYVERMEYLAIQVFVLCTIENEGYFEECNMGNEEIEN